MVIFFKPMYDKTITVDSGFVIFGIIKVSVSVIRATARLITSTSTLIILDHISSPNNFFVGIFEFLMSRRSQFRSDQVLR